MLRKPGGYRTTPMIKSARYLCSNGDEIDAWMLPVWTGIPGISLQDGHPAPFPLEIAERLIRLFSFVGDTVLDPFAGSGSTGVAAIGSGRNSISVEIEEEYLNTATRRAAREAADRLLRATPVLEVPNPSPCSGDPQQIWPESGAGLEWNEIDGTETSNSQNAGFVSTKPRSSEVDFVRWRQHIVAYRETKYDFSA